MKKSGMIALIAIFMTAMTLTAQEPAGNPNRPMKGNRPGKEMRMKLSPKERAEKMQKKLDLSVAETQKLQALFEKEDAQMKEMREKHQQEMQEKKEMGQQKFQQALEQHKKDVETIIGKEKAEKWDAIQQERMEKMKKRMEERRGDGPMDKPDEAGGEN